MAKILTEEEAKSLPKVVAVDFDGTLVGFTFTGIGRPNPAMIWIVKKLQAAGVKLILWTCRDNETEERELDAAIEFCKGYGIEFDAINDNIQEVKALTGNNTRKVFADIYLDDKGMFSPYELDSWAKKVGIL